MFLNRIINISRQSFSKVKFTFVLRDGTKKQVQAQHGQNILQISKKYDLGLQGACQASLACSTCHVYLTDKIYNKLKGPSDQQQDLLDLAFSLSNTSRLGCQVKVNQQFQGTEVTIPKASRNLYVDGTKPKSH